MNIKGTHKLGAGSVDQNWVSQNLWNSLKLLVFQDEASCHKLKQFLKVIGILRVEGWIWYEFGNLLYNLIHYGYQNSIIIILLWVSSHFFNFELYTFSYLFSKFIAKGAKIIDFHGVHKFDQSFWLEFLSDKLYHHQDVAQTSDEIALWETS